MESSAAIHHSTATPSTATSSSAAFGRLAFGIGQPRRGRRGRMDTVKWRSVRSDAIAWTMSWCSGKRHLRHLLRSYAAYYNQARTHLSLGKDAPLPRPVHATGVIIPRPFLGGPHHQYFRA